MEKEIKCKIFIDHDLNVESLINRASMFIENTGVRVIKMKFDQKDGDTESGYICSLSLFYISL